MTDILEDLYDNNSFTIFKLYFLLSSDNKDLRRFLKIDLVSLNKHLSQYHPLILNENMSKVYKNTGLILGVDILVIFSNYDIDNLKKISSSILSNIHENIPIINKEVNFSQNNTIINFTRGVRSDDEIMLLIGTDFNEKLNEDMRKWNSIMEKENK
jgi:hypothetical protein